MIEDNALNSTKKGFNDDAYGYDFCAWFFHLHLEEEQMHHQMILMERKEEGQLVR